MALLYIGTDDIPPTYWCQLVAKSPTSLGGCGVPGIRQCFAMVSHRQDFDGADHRVPGDVLELDRERAARDRGVKRFGDGAVGYACSRKMSKFVKTLVPSICTWNSRWPAPVATISAKCSFTWYLPAVPRTSMSVPAPPQRRSARTRRAYVHGVGNWNDLGDRGARVEVAISDPVHARSARERRPAGVDRVHAGHSQRVHDVERLRRKRRCHSEAGAHRQPGRRRGLTPPPQG